MSCGSLGVGARVHRTGRWVRGPGRPMWVGHGTVVRTAAGGCLSSPRSDAAVTPSSGEVLHYCWLATNTFFIDQPSQLPRGVTSTVCHNKTVDSGIFIYSETSHSEHP